MFPKIDSKWLMIEGILFILIGLFALFNPLMMALSLEIMLGSLLLVAGFVQGVRALTDLKATGSVPLLIGAAFALIAGIILLAYPLTGVLTLTLILIAFFVVDGISKLISGWQYRPVKGSGWLMLSGLISLALAMLIYSSFPTSAVWVIGIYFGIYLLFVGVALVTVSSYAKKAGSP